MTGLTLRRTLLHKAQGTSRIRCATYIAHVFEDNMKYMALSRVVEVDGLHIFDKLRDMKTAVNSAATTLVMAPCWERCALLLEHTEVD